MELLGNRGATHDRAAFEDPNADTRLRQIARADEAVVATTDNDDV